MQRWFRSSTAGFWLFFALAFAGSIVWAKSQDRFRRIWFTLNAPNAPKAEAVAVLPKLPPPFPVALFAYGSGESVLLSGNELRLLAEAGFAAVTFEYNKGAQDNYENQVTALQEYLGHQSWAKTNQSLW